MVWRVIRGLRVYYLSGAQARQCRKRDTPRAEPLAMEEVSTDTLTPMAIRSVDLHVAGIPKRNRQIRSLASLSIPMTDEDGLIVEVQAAETQFGAEANYLHGDDIVSVRIEPFGRTVVSYVRTESIHIDIDEGGYPVALEVLGPPVSAWQRRASLTPPPTEVARLRFLAREQETGSEEAFQTDDRGAILRVVITDRPSIRFVTPATGLTFGIDENRQLADLWITEFKSAPGQGRGQDA